MPNPLHRVRLTAAARADLRWWAEYLPRWSGTFPLVHPDDQSADTVLHADSSRWGTGACCGGRWWYLRWPADAPREAFPSMAWLELLPIFASCVLWGADWAGRRVRVYSDNMGVVGCVARGWSGDPRIMELLRHLLFAIACGDCVLSVSYVPTADNEPADSLSRGDLARFRRLQPSARADPDPEPPGLAEYLRAPDGGPGVLPGYRL